MKFEDKNNILDRAFAKLNNQELELAEQDIELNIERYISQDWFDSEYENMFLKIPRILIHNSELPDVNTFITVNDFGKPLLISRNSEHEVSAFLNVCRHRGATLESKKRGCKRIFSCKYHSWCYDNNGKLKSIPKAKSFPSVKLGERNLISVPIVEAFGFVWLMPEEGQTHNDIEVFLGGLTSDIDELDLNDYQIFGYKELICNANWKLIVEATMEAYHIPFLHRSSVNSIINDWVLFDQFGPHLRTFSSKRTLSLAKKIPNENISLRDYGNIIYTLFPHETILHVSDHFFWMTSCPISPNETLIKLRLLIPNGQMEEGDMKKWEDNRQFTYRIQDEDFEICESIQRGFQSNYKESVIFGMQEKALQVYSHNIDKHMKKKNL